uniref:MIF4G domain-containing protein n=1 Tax=Acrobeloides nanus TaxID=290746 RepID=A0A914C541_9BILA
MTLRLVACPFSKMNQNNSSYVESTCKRIRCILNKITPVTFDELIQEILEIIRVYADGSTKEIFADIMFNMAISDSRYCVMYADLCKSCCDLDNDFKKCIVQKCQKSFEYGVEYAKKTSGLAEACFEYAKKTSGLAEACCVDEEDEERVKQKLKMRGTIRFIGELYRHNIISDRITQWCLTHLINHYEETKNELFIEYAARLIEAIGLNYEKRIISNPSGEELMSHYLNKMIDQLAAQKENYSTRIRFMIIDLVDLRKNGWVDRRELARVIIPRAFRDLNVKTR